MNCTFIRKEHIASDIWTLYFQASSRFKYNAGQFIEMTLPHKNPDDRGVKRWFTLSSSPRDEFIAVTTRFLQIKPSTFKQTAYALEPKQSVSISDPLGDFTLPKDKTIPLLFVAGGIGITPFHSMLRWLHQQGETRDIRLLYGARKQSDFVFINEFKEHGINPVLVTQPVTPQDVLAPDNPEHLHIYLSGPEGMVKTLEHELRPLLKGSQQLVTDSFPGYSTI